MTRWQGYFTAVTVLAIARHLNALTGLVTLLILAFLVVEMLTLDLGKRHKR